MTDMIESPDTSSTATSLLRSSINRRTFLTRTLAGVGGTLIMGIDLGPRRVLASVVDTGAPVEAAELTQALMGPYVTIGTDNSITLTCPGAEMGQGISTALPMILAEELMVDWSNVKMVLAGAGDAFCRPTSKTALGTSQSSGGSNSVRGYHDYLRHLGAKIRLQMLTAAATFTPTAYALSELKVVDGSVVLASDPNQVVASYGQLASTAAGITISDTDPNIVWVAPANYKIIGTRKQRLDIPSKVDGSAGFGLDVRLPNMKYAAVKLAPKIGQTVGSSGPAPAGTTLVELTNDAGAKIGIAVVHPRSSWDAMRAVASTPVTWVDAAYTAQMDTAALTSKFTTLMAADFAAMVASGQAYVDTAKGLVGDADAALANTALAGTVHSATYSAPYVNHVTMEPMNATAVVNVDGSGTATSCEIWAPSQTQVSETSPGARDVAMSITGLAKDSVTMHTTFLGGGFGRRLKNDYVRYAVLVANHSAVRGTPVKVMWSREEDFSHDFHRPAAMVKFDAKVDGSKIVAFKSRVVGGRTNNKVVEALSTSAVDGISTALYKYDNKLVQWVDDQAQVPVASWRSVGNSQNCFFIESFMDELALAKGIDPIDFRIANIDATTTNGSRAVAVLNRLRSESGWDSAPASGRARGVALSMSFGDTVCAQVAEVSGTATTGFKVWKVTVVIDPFSVINPDTVEAQIESAVIQGLGTAMYNSQVLSQGSVTRRNFDTYRMIKLNEVPVEIKTIIIQSNQMKKGGVGEPGLPPIAPAVANALAKLNGTRHRDLPMTTSTVVNPPPPPPSTMPTITSFSPSKGRVGTKVTVVGTNFVNVRSVTLSSIATTFTVVSPTKLTFTVPRNAQSEKIKVTTASGVAESKTTFFVTR